MLIHWIRTKFFCLIEITASVISKMVTDSVVVNSLFAPIVLWAFIVGPRFMAYLYVFFLVLQTSC